MAGRLGGVKVRLMVLYGGWVLGRIRDLEQLGRTNDDDALGDPLGPGDPSLDRSGLP